MTIAACYLSPEGVVLGADSTATYSDHGRPHHYNHAQKLFEVGEGSSLGVITWGLGGLAVRSHRLLIGTLADDLEKNPASSVSEVAARWNDQFWSAYCTELASSIQRCQALNGKKPFDPNAASPDPDARTKDEEYEFQQLRTILVVGFCIAGYVLPDRAPAAFEIVLDPLSGKPTPTPLPVGWRFWGAPNIIHRLILGCDAGLKVDLLDSGRWNGTAADLDAMIAQRSLAHPVTVPIREALDFIHWCILSTIKAMKFSSLSPICGGPIELAVITTDRKFRWVQHKDWTTAIMEGAH